MMMMQEGATTPDAAAQAGQTEQRMERETEEGGVLVGGGSGGSTSTSTMSLLDLPNELRLMIIEHLAPRDLCCSIALVCRELYALQAHPHLWMRLFKQLLLYPRMMMTSSSPSSFTSSSRESLADDLSTMMMTVDELDEEEENNSLRQYSAWHSPLDGTSPSSSSSSTTTSSSSTSSSSSASSLSSSGASTPSSSSSASALPGKGLGTKVSATSKSTLIDLQQQQQQGGEPHAPFEDVWLLRAQCRVRQALEEGRPVDWKMEFIHRATFTVLIMAHHSAHQTYGSRYDLNLYRQLKRVGVPIVDICHPDCSEQDPLTLRERKCEDDALELSDRYVEFEWEKIRHYSAIFLFFATAPSLENATKMGDILHDFLKEGGGVVMGCYAYLDCNELRGRWSQALYPMPSSDYGSGSKNWDKGKFLGDHIADHPIMQEVKNIAIARDNRCESILSDGAVPVAFYGDGVPFVVLLDSEANRQHAGESEEQGSSASWGSTVYINLFPVAKSKQESGWYEATTDIPLVYRNALWHVARKTVTAQQRNLAS